MVAAQDSRVSVITGGGSGMGRATAVRLAQRGDSVCICDLKEDAINESAELIRSAGHTAYTGIVDVRNQAQVQAWIAEVIGKFGRTQRPCNRCRHDSRAMVSADRHSRYRNLQLLPGRAAAYGRTKIRVDRDYII